MSRMWWSILCTAACMKWTAASTQSDAAFCAVWSPLQCSTSLMSLWRCRCTIFIHPKGLLTTSLVDSSTRKAILLQQVEVRVAPHNAFARGPGAGIHWKSGVRLQGSSE
eukprot:1686404-Karenia_brevis.AAC.1